MRIHTAMQSCEDMHMHAPSFLTLLVLLEAISYSLRNPTFDNYTTRGSNTYFLVQERTINMLGPID